MTILQEVQGALFEWMKDHLMEAKELDLDELINLFGVGEVNLTRLGEEAIYDSGLVPEEDQLDAIEDETHEAWDAAVDAAEWFENLNVREA